MADHAGDVAGRAIDSCHHQVAGGDQGFAAHLFLSGAKGDFVNTVFGGLSCLAKARAHARQVLQFECHMLHDVCRVGAVFHALQKSAADPGLQWCSIKLGNNPMRRS